MTMVITHVIPWPTFWPKHYNGNCTSPCDMLVGPCVCGSWHKSGEFTFDDGQLRRQLSDESAESAPAQAPNKDPKAVPAQLDIRGYGWRVLRKALSLVWPAARAGFVEHVAYTKVAEEPARLPQRGGASPRIATEFHLSPHGVETMLLLTSGAFTYQLANQLDMEDAVDFIERWLGKVSQPQSPDARPGFRLFTPPNAQLDIYQNILVAVQPSE